MGHIRYEVATNVPVTLRPWFRQRLAWAAGEVRLFIANPQIAFRHPLFWFYGALLVILASPLRWESVFQPGVPLLLVGVTYCLLLFYFHFEHRDRYLLLLPFYGLFTSLVMVPLGVFAYARMVLRDRNFGFIRLQRGEELRQMLAIAPRAGRRTAAGAQRRLAQQRSGHARVDPVLQAERGDLRDDGRGVDRLERERADGSPVDLEI